MSDADRIDPPPEQRLYSVAEANALVPFLERVFGEIRLKRIEIRQRVEALRARGVEPTLEDGVPEGDPVSERLYSELRERHSEVVARLAELKEAGVEVKQIDGLVDVRTHYEGRVVYLCWRRGEKAFDYWHDLDAGFKGRKRVRERGAFVGTLLN